MEKSRRQKLDRLFALKFLLSSLLLTCGMVGIELFATSGFVKTGFPLIVGDIGGYNSQQFLGIAAATICLPLFSHTFGWITSSEYSNVSTNASISSLIYNLFIILSSIRLCWFFYYDWKASNLLDCGLFMCAWYGPHSKEGDTANGYFQLVSTPLCIFSGIQGASHSFILLLLLKRQRAEMSEENHNNVMEDESISLPSSSLDTPLIPFLGDVSTKSKRIHSHRLFLSREKLTSLSFVLIILLIGFLSGILLPNGWLNWTGHKIRVNAIEIVDHGSIFRDFKFGFVTRPEIPGAIFKTIAINLGEDVVGKIYPDVYLFYGYIVSICVVLPFFASLKRKMICMIILTLSFLMCFVHSWWYHNWHGWYGGIATFIFDEPSLYEKLARTLGQVSNVLLGLLAFPVGRNSPFNSLIGVSWEKMLGIHRFLANIFLINTLFHVFFWWKVFSDQDVLFHDALSGIFKSAPTYFPLNMHAKPGHCTTLTCLDPEYQKPAADNFTIPLMNFIGFYVILPIYGVLTFQKVRRLKFEWFYYLHQAFVFVIVLGVLWHAASSFIFLFPGFIVIIIDRFRRTYPTITQIERIISYQNFTSVTIQLKLNITPGQFIFIRVPEISEFENHPYSVAAINDRSVTIVAKATTQDGFSSKLSTLTVGSTILVEGPYGIPPTIHSRDGIIFVAGGIGITPIASLVMKSLSSSRIYLLWIIRDLELLKEFFPLLEFCREREIKIKLRSTSDILDSEYSGFPISTGRPNLQNEFTSFFEPEGNKNNLVFVCGPESLIVDTEETVKGFQNIEFHREVFEF